jgi:hypothetical protein
MEEEWMTPKKSNQLGVNHTLPPLTEAARTHHVDWKKEGRTEWMAGRG